MIDSIKTFGEIEKEATSVQVSKEIYGEIKKDKESAKTLSYEQNTDYRNWYFVNETNYYINFTTKKKYRFQSEVTAERLYNTLCNKIPNDYALKTCVEIKKEVYKYDKEKDDWSVRYYANKHIITAEMTPIKEFEIQDNEGENNNGNN